MKIDELKNVFKQEFTDFAKKKIFMIVTPPEYFVISNLALVKYLSKEIKKNGLIININEPSDSFYNKLKGIGVQKHNLTFIDNISRNSNEMKNLENCIFVNQPNSLVKLSSVISEVIEKRKVDFLLIDSISTFLMYNDETSVKQFLYYIINKLKMHEIAGFFLSTNDSQFKNLNTTITQITDRTIDLTKL